MNSKQRGQITRAGKYAAAQLQVIDLGHRLAEAEAEIAALRVAARDADMAIIAGQAQLTEALERAGELDTLLPVCFERQERIDALERRVRELEALDLDAAKLRRRLQDRQRELEAAHIKIRDLENQVRNGRQGFEFHREGG